MPVTLFLSPSTLVRSRRDLLTMLPHASVFCDSSSLHRLLRLRGVNIPLGSFDFSERIGVASGLFRRASVLRKRLLFVGGSPRDSEAFRDHVVARFDIPASRVVAIHGYHADIVGISLAAVRDSRPDYVVLGLGAPLQERVAIACMAAFPDVDIFTCGGFITQTALSGGDFYPAFFDRANLRWLYRIVRQPYVMKRIFSEYVIGYCLALRLGRRLCGKNCS